MSDPTKVLNLDGAIRAFVRGWSAPAASPEILRASGLYYLCPREFVLSYWFPRGSRKFDIKGHLMMSTGSHLHSILQNQILGPMGVLRGTWIRKDPKVVEEVVKGYHPDPELALFELSREKPQTWTYEELTVSDPKLRLYGHVDGIVNRDKIEWLSANGDLFVRDMKKAFKELSTLPNTPETESLLEVKTAGSYVFDKISTPKDISESYKMQSNVYQQLTNIHSVVFWYVGRNMMEWKVLPYWFESAWWKLAAKKAQAVWEAIRDEKLPEAFMACLTKNDTRAKGCEYSKECWSKWTDDSFKKYVEECKRLQPDRKWLDLSDLKFEEIPSV